MENRLIDQLPMIFELGERREFMQNWNRDVRFIHLFGGFRKTPISHNASSRFTNGRHGGIAVPDRPFKIVSARKSSDFPASVSGKSAGPMPPFKVKP